MTGANAARDVCFWPESVRTEFKDAQRSDAIRVGHPIVLKRWQGARPLDNGNASGSRMLHNNVRSRGDSSRKSKVFGSQLEGKSGED